MKQRLLREESPRWLAAQISEAGWVLVVELGSLKVFQEGRLADPPRDEMPMYRRACFCRATRGVLGGTVGTFPPLVPERGSKASSTTTEERRMMQKKGSVVAKSQERSQPQPAETLILPSESLMVFRLRQRIIHLLSSLVSPHNGAEQREGR